MEIISFHWGVTFPYFSQVGSKGDDQTFPITQISPLVFTASILIMVAIFMAIINRICWGPRINDEMLVELQVGRNCPSHNERLKAQIHNLSGPK